MGNGLTQQMKPTKVLVHIISWLFLHLATSDYTSYYKAKLSQKLSGFRITSYSIVILIRFYWDIWYIKCYLRQLYWIKHVSVYPILAVLGGSHWMDIKCSEAWLYASNYLRANATSMWSNVQSFITCIGIGCLYTPPESALTEYNARVKQVIYDL